MHLLWALLFLNTYDTKQNLADLVGVHEDTFRKWLWALVVAIAKLKPSVVSQVGFHKSLFGVRKTKSTNTVSHMLSLPQIQWSNRLWGDVGAICKILVDGMDFRFPQQYPPKEWYTYKFKSSGYWYKVALCIQTGEIVWINGPLKPGMFNNLSIFCQGLKQKLWQAREKAQADKGYRGEPAIVIVPNEFDNIKLKNLKKQVLLCHEHVNKRFKQFNCLKQTFWHPLNKHKSCFWAVAAVLTQIALENNEPLYSVQYGLHHQL